AVLSGSAVTGTLPVTWLYFNATQKSDKVALTWGTSAEMNSAYFVVERSANGIDFKEAGRVAASNNSVVDQHYSFNDAVTADQKLYYRLKQTDKDGTYNYSKIVTVQTVDQGTARIQPNPVQQSFRVQLPDNTQNAVLAIYNAAGIMVHKQNINHMQQINVQQLAAGVYYLNIQQGSKQYSLKMVKQ
ncbi:MAG TPA: T9SS type A sorting domain-containing protein, partial [Niastella sp.]